jgi:hypothetical protein
MPNSKINVHLLHPPPSPKTEKACSTAGLFVTRNRPTRMPLRDSCSGAYTLHKQKRLADAVIGGWSVATGAEAGSYLLLAAGFAFALHKLRSRMESESPAPPKHATVRLSDEEAVGDIISDPIFGLWATVNNLTRLKRSQRKRCRVTETLGVKPKLRRGCRVQSINPLNPDTRWSSRSWI